MLGMGKQHPHGMHNRVPGDRGTLVSRGWEQTENTATSRHVSSRGPEKSCGEDGGPGPLHSFPNPDAPERGDGWTVEDEEWRCCSLLVMSRGWHQAAGKSACACTGGLYVGVSVGVYVYLFVHLSVCVCASMCVCVCVCLCLRGVHTMSKDDI